MLTGTITVKKAYANYVDQSTVTQDVISLDRDLTYEFKGIDSSTCLYGELTTNDYDAIRYMASSTDDQDEMWVRRFDLNLNSIKPEREQWKDENGKTVKSAVNFDFFCMLGATIRYAKYRCRPECAVGYTGLQSASGEFTPESETEYIITSESANEADRLNLGTVRLKLGEFMSIHIETPVFSISVDEDPRMEIEVFSTIKNCQPKGFQFEEDYLGFKVDIYSGLAEANTDGMYTSLEDIIKNNPDREFSWLLGKKYIIVDDAMLDDVVKYFEDVPDNERIYFDTETSGLQITFRSRLGQDDQCVGIILSYEDGVSYFFPMQMRSIPNLCNGDHFYFMEHYMRHILENKRLVAHNMSFDWKVAYIYDINANIVDDTMALFNLTLGNEKENFPSGLKALTKLILHRDSLELSDLVASDSWGENDIRFWDLPKELVRLYACADTDNTRGLMQYAIQNDLLHRYNATKVYEIEIAFSYAVAYQEFYGHKIDVDNLDVLHKELDEGLSSNMAKMEEIVGYEFNPNSSKQLQRIMYTELGIPEQISRKTGRVTTDKETLKALSEITDLDGNPKYPFVAYLQKYREFEGIRKIVDKFPELSTPDGYIFSEVQQYGTTTGRVSVKKPNYQSYNDPVKKNVVPRPGFYMTDTDYSSVEYRVLGNIVGNKKIKEGFVDPDFDYHQYQAARMYGVPYASVTSKLRKAAKGINFGLPYGMGDQSLGVRVFGEESKENTLKAAALRAKYFEGQEDVKEFFDTTRAGGVANGYTETFFGRRRYYHRNKFSVAAIRRQAGNAVIQGCLGGDTRVMTEELGIMKLKDLADSRLHVWDGDKWSLGDVCYSGKKRKCIVHFAGGQSIVCSPIHKFLVKTSKGNEQWVECQKLRGADKFNNPSHVLFNHNYEASEYCYTSEDMYASCGSTANANNVLLEDIGDRFDIGVFLGRLASDGSYSVREDGGSYISQIVAEHEYGILPELRRIMANLGLIENNRGVRDGRTQGVTHLNVYSKSLAREVEHLDIKHQIHDNIFMDTEVLRGFLRGFFDGDGGITGKTITLVFGTQYDFEPMCLDIQKALLFFGVRSHYRKYSDRYVIQVKTNDNDMFLKMIGFVNQDKQRKGEGLNCATDEHVFGKTMRVSSVEITDEYIDMYDVCNTDGGYFVADGLITHNTAADVYKLAVGRLFLRICKEGWLGKVLFTGFIHDEVLCEVHCSIDPMKWLKVLREEFEVKIKGWCPLYMGFGFGMSWYEAKKTELPIQLQWELVEKYGETGYPKWHGDGKELCAEIPDMLRDFSIRHAEASLKDPAYQGKEIKPATNKLVIDIIDEDVGYYNKIVPDALKAVLPDYDVSVESIDTSVLGDRAEEIISGINEKLRAEHIDGVLYAENGELITQLSKLKETQAAIDLYCRLHSVDRSLIDVKNLAEGTVNADAPAGLSDVAGFSGGEDDETDMQALADSRVEAFGMFLDTDESRVILKMLPPQYMEFIRQRCNKEQNGYRIRFKDTANRMFYDTECYLPSEEVPTIQSMYIQYFKQTAGSTGK